MADEPENKMSAVEAALNDLSLPPTHPAMWITCSPHEWKWKQADQERMARDVLYLADEVLRLRDENAKLRERTQWSPIESAPAVGKHIYLYGNEKKFCFSHEKTTVGYYEIGERCFIELYTGRTLNPTHWMPLPDAPESEVRG